MKNKWLWLIGGGAALWFFLKGGLSAFTSAKNQAQVNTANSNGLAPAYRNVVDNPSADNIAALVTASGGAFTSVTNAFKSWLPGSTSASPSFKPLPQVPASAADYAAANAAGDAYNASLDYSGFDGGAYSYTDTSGAYAL